MNTVSIMPPGLETTLEKVGKSLTERFGIRVVCGGNRCCTDGRTIYLPSLPDELPDRIIRVIRGFLDHEAGHVCAKSNFRIGQWFRNKYGADGFNWLNILEDLRIEEHMRQRFPGCRRNFTESYDFSVEKAAERAGPLTPLKQLAFGVCSRGNRLPDLPFVSDAVYQALDSISGDILKAPRCRNTKGVARLAEKTWPIVSMLLEPPPPSPQSSPAEQEQDSTSPSQSGGASPSQGHTQPATTQPDSNDDGTSQAEEEATAHAVPGRSTSSPADFDITRDLGQSIVTLVNDYAGTNQAYRVWTTAYDTVKTARNSSTIPHNRRMAKLLPHVAGVRQKLLQTLLAEPKARWIGDREYGRINPRALYRLATTDTPANDRVFREKTRTKRLHTAVTLLVDVSNSMEGKRIILATNTALIFCEALSRLNIPCNVITFSTSRRSPYDNDTEQKTGMSWAELTGRYRIMPLRHVVYKHFDEPFRAVSGRFDAITATGLTPLGESILFAARALAERREERKALFVITDGAPEVGLGGDKATFDHAKAAIKRVEQARIDVALVGIHTASVYELHHRSVVVNCLEELPKTVMKKLHEILVSN